MSVEISQRSQISGFFYGDLDEIPPYHDPEISPVATPSTAPEVENEPTESLPYTYGLEELSPEGLAICLESVRKETIRLENEYDLCLQKIAELVQQRRDRALVDPELTHLKGELSSQAKKLEDKQLEHQRKETELEALAVILGKAAKKFLDKTADLNLAIHKENNEDRDAILSSQAKRLDRLDKLGSNQNDLIEAIATLATEIKEIEQSAISTQDRIKIKEEALAQELQEPLSLEAEAKSLKQSIEIKGQEENIIKICSLASKRFSMPTLEESKTVLPEPVQKIRKRKHDDAEVIATQSVVSVASVAMAISESSISSSSSSASSSSSSKGNAHSIRRIPKKTEKIAAPKIEIDSSTLATPSQSNKPTSEEMSSEVATSTYPDSKIYQGARNEAGQYHGLGALTITYRNKSNNSVNYKIKFSGTFVNGELPNGNAIRYFYGGMASYHYTGDLKNYVFCEEGQFRYFQNDKLTHYFDGRFNGTDCEGVLLKYEDEIEPVSYPGKYELSEFWPEILRERAFKS